MKICHLETLMRESPRSPALLARFISRENAHNSYPGVLQNGGSEATEERPSWSDPQAAAWFVFFFLSPEAPMMSRGDSLFLNAPLTSAIVRHVCGVRSLGKSCSGQSAASLAYSERVERRSSRSAAARRCSVAALAPRLWRWTREHGVMSLSTATPFWRKGEWNRFAQIYKGYIRRGEGSTRWQL